MKKLLMSLLLVISIIGFSPAQKAPAAQKTTKTKTTTTVQTTDKGMKKDGTPDMRLKENKMKKEGPKKKDGTADMRYKANKKK